jgi:NAD(P)-dependent dehydrogenase (short-subunit alcohol dehydrogenase family)
VVHARNNHAGAEVVAGEVRQAGGQAVIVIGDLADVRTAQLLVTTACEAHGGLDVVVANAGFANRTTLADLEADAYAASISALQDGFFHLVRAALPALAKAQDGRIVAISSFVAHLFRRDLPLFPATAVAKAGIEAMVKALAIELAPNGVTVNAVAPGFTEKDPSAHTALTPERWRELAQSIPLGRLGKPAEIAAAVAFLAAPEAGYITGQVLHVNGGLVI